MRILVNIHKNDFRFINLVKPLEYLEYPLGVVNGLLDQDTVDKFVPDIIIHNGYHNCNGNFIDIQIDDLTYGILGPFTSLSNCSPEQDQRFESDISYIGDMKEIPWFHSLFLTDYNIKIFSHIPYMFTAYCGNVSQQDTATIYKNSKVSIVPLTDLGYREMDIIICDGNPLKTNSVQDVKDCLNAKQFVKNFTKQEILDKYTNYDKLSEVFNNKGLKAVASKIKEGKK